MKTTISLYDFRDAFRRADRTNNFSYEGLAVLFDYLEEYEDATGDSIELDVIALCCDYSEGTPEEIARDYGYAFDEEEDEDERRDNLIEWLNDQTMVCGVTEAGSIVYQSF